MRRTASSLPRALSGFLLALALIFGATIAQAAGANQWAARYNSLSHQMICTCGCAQLLGECNHVGCPNSPGMLKTLESDLSHGMGDHAILVEFAQSYGPAALASPLLTRFNQAAWVVPPAILLLGLLGALVLVRRRREGAYLTQKDAQIQAQQAVATPAESLRQQNALARVRREIGQEVDGL